MRISKLNRASTKYLCHFDTFLSFVKLTHQLNTFLDFRCDSSNDANINDPASSQERLNVFFPPKNLEIIVERPESRVQDGQYDRTTEYIGDKLKQLTQSPRNINGLEVPRRTSPASRNERIRLVIAGELVRLKCVAGKF